MQATANSINQKPALLQPIGGPNITKIPPIMNILANTRNSNNISSVVVSVNNAKMRDVIEGCAYAQKQKQMHLTANEKGIIQQGDM